MFFLVEIFTLCIFYREESKIYKKKIRKKTKKNKQEFDPGSE